MVTYFTSFFQIMNLLLIKDSRTIENNWLVLLPAIIVCLFFLLSCKKDLDTQHPVIVYQSPTVLQEFEVLDIISVIAEISDDRIIESVKVELVNKEFSPILPAVVLYPKSANYHLDIEYPIEDVYIESGEYYMHIRAEDGTNFKSQYQLVKIIGIPRQFEKLIVLTYQNFNKIRVSEIDKLDNLNFLFDIRWGL